MIKNIVEQKSGEKLRYKLYRFIAMILEQIIPNSYLLAFVYLCVWTFFQSAIFFKASLFSSSSFLEKITWTLGQNWNKLTGIQEQTMDIIILVSHISGLVIMILGFYNSTRLMIRVAAFCYSTSIFLAVPISTMTAYNLQKIVLTLRNEQTPGLQWSIKLLQVILSCLWLSMFHLLFFFSFKPVRRQNIFWRLSNKTDFLRVLMGTARALVLTWGRISIVPIFISFYVELQILTLAKEKYQFLIEDKISAFMNIPRNFIISIHIIILLHYLTNNTEVLIKVFLASIALNVINSLTNFIYLSKKALVLPKCQRKNNVRIYNFYFEFMKMNKEIEEDALQNILVAHRLVCSGEIMNKISYIGLSRQKKTVECYFSSRNESQSSKYLSCQISQLLSDNSQSQPEAEILNELWNYELYKKSTLQMSSREFIPEHEYIIHFITSDLLKSNTTFTQRNVESDPEKVEQMRKQIFQLFEMTMSCYGSLYQELSKSRPQLSVLTQNIQKACTLSTKVDQTIQVLCSLKKLDFALVELYFIFVQTFPVSLKSSQFLKKKLTKSQINQQSTSIRQINLPCLQVNQETGKIQDFNKEAMKFLRAKKIELRNKRIQHIFQPPITISLFQNTNLELEKAQVFVKTGSTYNVTNINLLKRYSSKVSTLLIFKPLPYRLNQAEILVDKTSLKLILSNQEILCLSTHHQALSAQKLNQEHILNINDAYELVLRQLIKQMITQNKTTVHKKVKFESEWLILHMTENECFVSEVRHFSIRIMAASAIDQNTEIKKRFTLQASQSTFFSFNYTQCSSTEDKLTILGRTGLSQPVSQEIGMLLHSDCQSKRVEKSAIEIINKQFQQGIRTYRLYQQQLFNIDLQDKAAYEKQFDANKHTFTDQFYKQKGLLNLLQFFMIIVSMFMFSLTIIVDQMYFGRLATVPILNNSLGRMESFLLQSSRINSLLRDGENGLFNKYDLDFEPQIFLALRRMQTFSSEIIFNPQASYEVSFGEKILEGNLNELYQYSFHEVQFILNEQDSQRIQNLHDLTITKLTRFANQERKMKHLQIKEVMREGEIVLQFCGYTLLLFVTIVLILSYYIRQLHNLKFALQIEPLLMLSESLIEKLQEEVLAFKQYLSSHEKGSGGKDWQKINRPHHKQRKKPKHILTGLQANISGIVMGTMIILFSYVSIIVAFKILKSNSDKIIEMVEQQSAIFRVYVSLSEISNELEHLGILPVTAYDQLEEKISLLENWKHSFYFSEALTEDIQQALYDNSCSYAVNNGYLQSFDNCSKSQPNFFVQNPFELGLLFFLRDQHYNLLDNLTDTFGSTGIFSEPMSTLFRQLGQRCFEETSQWVINFDRILSTMNMFITPFAVLMSFSFIIIFAMLSRTGQKIRWYFYQLDLEKITS